MCGVNKFYAFIKPFLATFKYSYMYCIPTLANVNRKTLKVKNHFYNEKIIFL